MTIGRAAQPMFASHRRPKRPAPMGRTAPVDQGVIAKTAVFSPDRVEWFLFFIAATLGIAAYAVDEQLTDIANTGVPVLLVLALGWGCVRMAIQQVETILTPTFVMRVAMLFYGGVGSLVPIYGSDETKTLIERFFDFSELELLKYNLVVIAFVITFNISMVLFRIIFYQITSLFRVRGKSFGIDQSNLSLAVVAAGFLILGAVAKYLIILPFQFGFIQGTYPVIIAQFALLENIGLFLGLVWAYRKSRFFVPFFIVYGIFVSIIGLLTFSKTDAIFPIIMIVAAYVYVAPSIRRFAIALATILFVFNLTQPIVTHGRAWLQRDFATITAAAGFGERFNIISAYFNGNAIQDNDNVNYALVRFSYANVGTFVITARDNGWEGDTLKYIGTFFIPRVLWPDKPVITDIGVDLNVAITGNPYSAVATGLAPEGYWDGGWLGVALMALTTSIICYLWTLYSIEVQRVGAWHLFVVVLLGIRTGLRFDGFFVTDIAGSLIYAMIAHLLLMLLNRAVALRT